MAKKTDKQIVDEKAVKTGVTDGFLTVLFASLGMLLTWAATELVPLLDTFEGGKYAWAKAIVGMLIGAAIKALDRKRHEDSSPRNGLVEV
jgi:membrane associated rhomboid family serine protease